MGRLPFLLALCLFFPVWAADGPVIGSYPARVNGGDFNFGFITITFVPNTEASRLKLGRNHDMVNVTGSAHQTFGCDTGLMDANPTIWCNSHDNRFVTNPIADNDWNKVGRCAGNMRVACWRPGTVSAPLVSDPDYDYCDTVDLGDCYDKYWNYYRARNRDTWARDTHGHKAIDYWTHRSNPNQCNYEEASGYCESGTYAGQGCTGDEDCGILSTGTCSGMCNDSSDDPGEFCISDGDCTGGGACIDSDATSGLGLKAAKDATCTEFDGSDCNSGFCYFESYTCGNKTYACGYTPDGPNQVGGTCSEAIPSPTTHPIYNVTMNYKGDHAPHFTDCRVLHNNEIGSDWPEFYADYSADEVQPWAGSVPVAGSGAAASPMEWNGNEWGGKATGRNEVGGGVVVHFSDNSNAFHFGVDPGTAQVRRCSIKQCSDTPTTTCTKNADCPGGETCDFVTCANNSACSSVSRGLCYTNRKGENGVRSEYDHSKVRPAGESIAQALNMYSLEAKATHAAGGLSGGAMASIWFKVAATCADYSADYGNPDPPAYRCKLNNKNTEYYCDIANGDLDCQRMYWDSSLRVLAGGYYCNRSMRNCPNQNECTTSDGTCTYYEPTDLIETESGNPLRGNSCYDKSGAAGTACVDNDDPWHINEDRDSGDGVWESETYDKAILKLQYWWEAADATTALASRGRGGGEPRRPMMDMVLSNHLDPMEHGKGIFSSDSNRYLFGWTYLWAIPQKNHHFINLWTGTPSLTHCLHCKSANYPAPSCTGYQSCYDYDYCSSTKSQPCSNDENCPVGETCEPNLFTDVLPWGSMSLGCATGPGSDDFKKYGVDNNVYYRNFTKGFVACNFQSLKGCSNGDPCNNNDDCDGSCTLRSDLSITLPTNAPDGTPAKWCTMLADNERVDEITPSGPGKQYDCNSNGDDQVQDYDGDVGGSGFTGSQDIDQMTCIIMFDEGSTQPDCDPLPEYQYSSTVEVGSAGWKGFSIKGGTIK